MYSTINNYFHGLSRQQTKSKTLTIDPEAEKVLLKVFCPDGLDSKFTEATEATDLVGDSASGSTAKFITLTPEPPADKSGSIENNIALLEQEIEQLGKTITQATEQKLNFLNGQFNQGMDKLDEQAEYINGLAAELEAEILKFQVMAKQVNRDYHAIQDPRPRSNPTLPESDRPRPAKNIWAIRSCAIPIVIKQGNQLILTTKQVLEVSEDSAENRVKKAQQRQKALASWLEAKRQRIVEDFSRP